MKTRKILDKLGSIEKNAFIKVIDNIISKQPTEHKEIDCILSSVDHKGLKSVDNQNISKIFALTKQEFLGYIQDEFQNTASQLDILVDILIRDGNCILSRDWFSRLYEKELKTIKTKVKTLQTAIKNDKSDLKSRQEKRLSNL